MSSYKPDNVTPDEQKKGYRVVDLTISGRTVQQYNCLKCQFDTIMGLSAMVKHIKKNKHPWGFEPTPTPEEVAQQQEIQQEIEKEEV